MLNANTIQIGMQCHYQNICGWKMQITTFDISYINKEFLAIIKNGRILQTAEQMLPQTFDNQVTLNLELVKHLTQKLEYQYKEKRIGRQIVYWKQQRILAGGFYDENGMKVGYWIELFDKYWDKSQIFFEGIYNEGKRQGRWNTKKLGKIIGGGNYNENGKKDGKWIELHNNFYDQCELFYIGEYKSGQRAGLWKIMNKNKQMCGGFYNEDGQKHGRWIDPYELYFNFCQVIYSGQYENGIKYGRWDTLHLQLGNLNFKVIGGGNYNQVGLKNGIWKELHSNFQEFSVVVYEGKYQDGLKIGKWQILYRKFAEEKIQIIGSGFYNEYGEKTGQWKEQDSNFWDESLIIHVGQYQFGKRIDRWDITYQDKLIGGGFYDQEGRKKGNWIDLDENFSSSSQIQYKGEYINGFKVGLWFTIDYFDQDFSLIIGAGIYDNSGMKNGKWLDLSDYFRQNSQVLQIGKYKNGIQCGNWKQFYKPHKSLSFQKIGYGQYDDNGKKNGFWMELIDNYQDNCQVILVGEYKDSYKQGRWNALFRAMNEYTFKILGGGIYKTNGFKDGIWTELQENFSNFWQKTNNLEYTNGIQQKLVE